MTMLLMETARDLTTRLDHELRRPNGEKPKRQALRNLARSADALAGLILSAWVWVSETLEEEGFEGRELAQHCQVLVNGIDECLFAHQKILEGTTVCGLTPISAGLDDLEGKLPALREVRSNVTRILALATRPPRPIDESMLAEARRAIERGELIKVDEQLLSRLETGEDV